MTTLAIRKDEAPAPEWTQEQKDLIKRTVARGATDDELALLLYTAKRLGLDLLTRQMHFSKRRVWNQKKNSYDEVGVIQIGIDGFRAQAERTGKYAGQDPPVYEFSDDGRTLVAATVSIYRKDFPRPIAATAYYDEYVQTAFDKKTNERRPNSMWAKMPRMMLAKCAEALALRKAFPQDLSGLYTEEEVEVIGDAISVESPGKVERESDAPQLVGPPKAVIPPDKLKVLYQIQKHFTVISGNTYFLKDHSKTLGAKLEGTVWKMHPSRTHELLSLCDKLHLDYQELDEAGKPIIDLEPAGTWTEENLPQ